MYLTRAAMSGVTIAAVLSLPTFANAPPIAAPRTPVTVQQLPPVQKAQPAVTTAVTVPPPKPVAAPEQPLWRQPWLYAFIALADTLAASFVTVMYLRNPSPNLIRLSAALTGSSALFIAAAVAAWLL